MSEQEPAQSRAEDNLADGIAELWGELDARAAAEENPEARENEQLILSWVGKLAEILKGPSR